MKHVISINDFSKEEIFDEILPGCHSCIDLAKGKLPITPQLHKKATLAFFEPSTRTKGSYKEASRKWGWSCDVIDGEEATSLTKKESMANTARMLASQGADVLVMRTKIEGAQRFIAEILEEEGYEISVQNGGDGTNQHPTQTFLDLLTISRWLKKMDNFKIGYCGDLKYGRTVHSLLCALSYRKEISVVLVSPAETKLQEQYKGLFPGKIQEGDELESLADCDVIYLSRIQEERFRLDPIALQRIRDKFRITKDLLDTFKKDVIIMHPMPYVTEITPEVRRDKRIIIDDQAWCGIPTRMFLLDEGYKNRNEKTLADHLRGEMLSVKKMTIKDYWQEKEGNKKRETHFRPIKSGTVIDHIPVGLGVKISNILTISHLINGNGVEHLIRDKNPNRGKLEKEIILLDGDYLKPEVMIDIASLAPAVTFNVIKNETFEKLRLKSHSLITGIGKCPNETCITRRDPEAQPKFKPNGNLLSCYYCEKQFNREEVI